MEDFVQVEPPWFKWLLSGRFLWCTQFLRENQRKLIKIVSNQQHKPDLCAIPIALNDITPTVIFSLRMYLNSVLRKFQDTCSLWHNRWQQWPADEKYYIFCDNFISTLFLEICQRQNSYFITTFLTILNPVHTELHRMHTNTTFCWNIVTFRTPF